MDSEIENLKYVRDNKSNALLANDKELLRRFKKDKELRNRINKLEKQVDELLQSFQHINSKEQDLNNVDK